MKVYKGKIPSGSLVNNYLPVNYSDVYVCPVSDLGEITSDDIQVTFWTVMPNWLESLYKIRNLMVKPFGLKGGDSRNPAEFEKCIRSGGEYNFVSVPAKSENETVLRLADKHLIAYLSVYIESTDGVKNVYTTTLVNFNNKLGYIYFYTIYPFHHLVVKKMLKSTISRLINK